MHVLCCAVVRALLSTDTPESTSAQEHFCAKLGPVTYCTAAAVPLVSGGQALQAAMAVANGNLALVVVSLGFARGRDVTQARSLCH
jgi:hypothetical protein